jgi:hypothetical protein
MLAQRDLPQWELGDAIMKIESSGPTRVAASSAVRRGQGPGGTRFTIESTAERSATPLAASSPLASVSALLAVQGAPDPADGRSRGLARGDMLLVRLDEIRLGLLTDGIPRQALQALALELRRSREGVSDARIAAVLDEIELRAMVELAKYDDGVEFKNYV